MPQENGETSPIILGTLVTRQTYVRRMLLVLILFKTKVHNRTLTYKETNFLRKGRDSEFDMDISVLDGIKKTSGSTRGV